MPTGRTVEKGDNIFQNFAYNFDSETGNLLSRTDVNRNTTESFQYDGLNRLIRSSGNAITYSDNGNILQKQSVGSLTYSNINRPYQVTGLTPHAGYNIPTIQQSLGFTSFQRPAWIEENADAALFEYNASHDRVKMSIYNQGIDVVTRYYCDNRYELHLPRGGSSKEMLYLGGDAYSAPAVYVKEANTGKIYYICRDYLGSITHVLNSDGTLNQELSYDAWGRFRNPDTHEVYAQSNQPVLFLGRGYTGHEHLPWFGLINMNARLYDPVLGRFLSADPYVQIEDFTQNYNRYSYCLNNPLIYRDENGKFIHLLIGAAIGGILNWMINGFQFNLKGLASFGIGALAGGLSAGIGAGISSVLPVAGKAAGGFMAGFLGTSAATTATSSFVSGALIGGGAGLSGGFTVGFGNALIDGKKFGQALGQGGIYGLIGMGPGALVGGLWGGFDAVGGGREFWDGATVQKTILVEQNIPTVGQIGEYNCLPASAEAVDGSFGGNLKQSNIRNLVESGSDSNTVGLTDTDVWEAYRRASGHRWDGVRTATPSDKLSNILAGMQKGIRVAINLNTGDIGHSVVMQSIVQKTVTKINGTIIQKLIYNVMDPAYGGRVISIGANSIINSNNIFYIFP